MKVLLLGASGFIGTKLSAALAQKGVAVVSASLRRPVEAAKAATGCDAIINLAGASVAQRWTPKVKHDILESRTALPQLFFSALRDEPARPKHYISASAIGYYGVSESAEFDEQSPAGQGFLAEVCREWEHEAARALEMEMALTIVRTGLVVGRGGGAMARLLPIFQLGLGGPVASGKQWYSWIHIDDMVGIYQHALDGVEGILNATAPTPLRNVDFTHALGRALHRPTLFPVPAIAIKMLLGEGATVVVDGQCVLPKRTLATGYTFQYADAERAFTALYR
jgi:uncharacterized protein (TIGR01777 family)